MLKNVLLELPLQDGRWPIVVARAGMEYVRTHNLDLARNFLLGALSLSPADPLVLNEVGWRLDAIGANSG